MSGSTVANGAGVNGSEAIEGTATEIVPAAADHHLASVFRTDDPIEIMQRTAEIAGGLRHFVRAQGLSKRIGPSDHIQVEGWQMLGMMLGCTAVITSTSPIDDGAGWEARAELRDRSGRVIGAGDAQCLKAESKWKSADDYARRSMAQTRAIGKAFRSVFGFIAKSAGYEAAPAEEVDGQPQAQQNGRAAKAAEPPKPKGRKIGAGRVRKIVERTFTLGVEDKLQTSLAFVRGDDLGPCDTKPKAEKAVGQLVAEEATRVEKWLDRKAEEAQS